jgi:hypothetical protein
MNWFEKLKEALSLVPTLIPVIDWCFAKFTINPILPVSRHVVLDVGIITIIGTAAAGFAGNRALRTWQPSRRWPAWFTLALFLACVVFVIFVQSQDTQGPSAFPAETRAFLMRALYFLVFSFLGFTVGGFSAK